MALQLSPGGRRYGYHRNPPDHRDKGLGAIRLVQATLPAMSNAKYMGPVLDQGQQGSCTAHAGVADREYLHNKQLAALGHKYRLDVYTATARCCVSNDRSTRVIQPSISVLHGKETRWNLGSRRLWIDWKNFLPSS